MASTDKSLNFSDNFVISCGTITVDVAASKALLIHSRKTGDCYLPKGRKNIGESLEAAAERETYEETGVRTQILPVGIATCATTTAGLAIRAGPHSVTQPIAVSQRVTSGVLKIIFWFVAAADSTAVPDEGTQQVGEDFDTRWTPFEDVIATLTFEDDFRIAEAGIRAALATATPM